MYHALENNLPNKPWLAVYDRSEPGDKKGAVLLSWPELASARHKLGVTDSVTMLMLIDLESNFGKLKKLTDPDRFFTMEDLSKAAGMHQSKLTYWVPAVIRASVHSSQGRKGRPRLFSFVDVFVAAQCASLKRNGVPIDPTLKNVSKMIYALASDPNERTALRAPKKKKRRQRTK